MSHWGWPSNLVYGRSRRSIYWMSRGRGPALLRGCSEDLRWRIGLVCPSGRGKPTFRKPLSQHQRHPLSGDCGVWVAEITAWHWFTWVIPNWPRAFCFSPQGQARIWERAGRLSTSSRALGWAQQSWCPIFARVASQHWTGLWTGVFYCFKAGRNRTGWMDRLRAL